MQRGRKRAEFLWNESTYGISSISYSYRFYYLEGLYYISLKKKLLFNVYSFERKKKS